jgi:hypothetical protein
VIQAVCWKGGQLGWHDRILRICENVLFEGLREVCRAAGRQRFTRLG